MGRVIAALLAICVLTAFAPAPLPKRSRTDPAVLNLQNCQGKWQVVRKESVTTDGKLPLVQTNPSTSVRIQGGEWITLDAEGVELSRFTITIDASAKPPRIAWHLPGSNQGEAGLAWVGRLRREGEHVQVLYTTPSRPAPDFTAPPFGSVLITLRKVEDRR
jgi:uncharacterized protein (TIGR03067 family)